MEKRTIGPLHIGCVQCGLLRERTAWLPPKGLESLLRQYRCKWCEDDVYELARISTPEQASFPSLE